MQAQELTGREAVVATLRAKLAVASKREMYGATKAQRQAEAIAAKTYRARLRAMGEEV